MDNLGETAGDICTLPMVIAYELLNAHPEQGCTAWTWTYANSLKIHFSPVTLAINIHTAII